MLWQHWRQKVDRLNETIAKVPHRNGTLAKCEGMSMNIEELKQLAEAATPRPWAHGVTWI